MLYAPFSDYSMAKEGCYVCGKPDHLINMEVQIEGEGQLAVCVSCLLQGLHIANHSDECDQKVDVAELEDQVKTLTKEKRELGKRLREATKKTPAAAAA